MLQGRSHTYDNLSTKLKGLAQLICKQDEVLLKSKESEKFVKGDSSLGNDIGQVIQLHKGAENVGNDLQKAFEDLRSDFNTGVIQQSRYVGMLREYSEFLRISDLEKSDLPASLKADVILKEIARFM